MAAIQEEILYDEEATGHLFELLAESVLAGIIGTEPVVLVGIRQGGAVVARLLRAHLGRKLARQLPLGFLDITFYRDDLDTVGPNPVLAATELHFDIDEKRVILVDDVIYTGRTIRAALNVLFDYGRPQRVDLAVLVDRGGRQLPIQPDFVGKTVPAGEQESIKLKTGRDGGMTVVRRFPSAPEHPQTAGG